MPNSNIRRLLVAALTLSAVGCASWFARGGRLVSEQYNPVILVNYDIEGPIPPNTSYHLVKTEKGEAIFERSADGSGALIETHWKKDGADHYAMWVRRSHAYEYVMPEDRTKPGKKYLYPAGFYQLETIDGVERAVPVTPVDPVATLIPK